MNMEEALAKFIEEVQNLIDLYGEENVRRELSIHLPALRAYIDRDDREFDDLRSNSLFLTERTGSTGRLVDDILSFGRGADDAAAPGGRVSSRASKGRGAKGAKGALALGALSNLNFDVNIDGVSTVEPLTIQSKTLDQIAKLLLKSNVAMEKLSDIMTSSQAILAQKLDNLDDNFDELIAAVDPDIESRAQVKAKQAASPSRRMRDPGSAVRRRRED